MQKNSSHAYFPLQEHLIMAMPFAGSTKRRQVAIIQETRSLNCRFCNQEFKEFKIRSHFMNHRKDNHCEIVPICKNYINGSCEHVSCWFKHSETVPEKTTLVENKNFNENFAQRIAMMEKYFHTTPKLHQI
jgi:hypothetical protein